jgi:hypothetical protein
MTDLESLLERVEEASGADRELDGDLWWVLDHGPAEAVFNNGSLGMPRRYPATLPMREGLGRAGVRAMAPELTASIEAVIKLGRRVADVAPAYIIMGGIAGCDPHAPVDVLARRSLAALLRALISQPSQNQAEEM